MSANASCDRIRRHARWRPLDVRGRTSHMEAEMRSLAAGAGIALMCVFGTPLGVPASPGAGITITQITHTTVCGNEYATFDASGNRFAFESNCDWVPPGNADQSSEVFTMNADGTDVTQITAGVGGIGNVWINASGRRIVFATTRDLVPGENADGNTEIFIMDVDGGNLRQLTHTTGTNHEGIANYLPAVDYAGKHVYFTSSLFGAVGDTKRLFAVNSDGTGLRQLTTGDGASPSVDAKGNVYFIAGNVFRIKPDGSQLVPLGPPELLAHGNEKTGVDAAGSRLVFTSFTDVVPGGNTDGSREVFLLDIKTGGITQITSTSGPGLGCRTPSLSADGNTILFSCDGDLTGSNPDRNRELFLAELR